MEEGDLGGQSFEKDVGSPWTPFRVFARCWAWTIPIGAILAFLGALAVIASYVPRFRAVHLLERTEDSFAPEWKRDLSDTERDFVFNSHVLHAVLDDSELRKAPSLSDPATAKQNLRANLSVESAGSMVRMSFAYTDTDSVAAADICNAIVTSYLRRRMQYDSQRYRALERWIRPEVTRWETEVEEKKRIVQTLGAAILGYKYEPQQLKEDERGDLLSVLRVKVAEAEVEVLLYGFEETEQSRERLESKSRDYSGEIEDRLVAAKERLRTLRIQYERENEMYATMHTSYKLVFAVEELELASEILMQLRGLLEKIRHARQLGNIRTLASATPPESPLNPFPWQRLAAFLLAGFCSPFFFAYFLGLTPRNRDRHSGNGLKGADNSTAG